MDILLAYLEMIDSRLLHHLGGKYQKAVEMLRTQSFTSEKAFAMALLGEDYNARAYQSLKGRMISMLQALAVATDTAEGSTVKRKHDLCQKNLLIARKLLKKGIRSEGIRLAKQGYKIAVEYNLVHLACEFSSILYNHYMLYKPSSKQAKRYAQEMEKYSEDYRIEKKAEYYFLQATGKKNKAKYTERLEEIVSNVVALNGTSLIYLSYKSSLEVLHSFSIADYPTAIKSCREILEIFKTKKGAYASHYQFFLTKQGLAQMATGDYAEAKESFQQAEKHVPARSYNDYILRLWQTVNALHSGDYQLAYDLYQKYKKCRFETIRQQFAIIEAYICFLAHMGYLELEHTFRLGKYLNDTIASQANKQGENIAILIAELLILYVRDRGKYMDRIESAKSYSYRHLRSKSTLRAKHLIKILCHLPDVNFHLETLHDRMGKHLNYIRDNPVQIGEDISFTEFVPFDKLLDILLLSLERGLPMYPQRQAAQ